ncbi:methionine--tRNA ligase, partial [Candidatus Cerribacteria bacterium 'Amazon FNV 2010 28 9']
PGDSSQVMYVWFDALAIYMTGIGYGWDDQQWKRYWPADMHVIGKDIVRFHAIYWIGMLLSAHLPLPKTIMTHGHITSGGQKMSKSIGNVIDPYEVVARYGVDFTRYYLLSEIPTLDDGDFTYSRADELYTSDFANGIGNLASRVSTLCEKSEGCFPIRPCTIDPQVAQYIESYAIREAIQSIWKHVRDLNKKISDAEPWKLPSSELEAFLVPIVEELRCIAVSLSPFLPQLSANLTHHFLQEHIYKINPLFPRLQK